MGESLVQDLLAAKGAIVAGWIVLALALEQWRPAAPPPIHLAGYGAAWFKRWARNLGFFILNGALSTLFVLPVTVWAALHAPWSRADLVGWPDSVQVWAWLPLDILLLEFWIYWWHRANHEWRFLWRFHEVHHRDRHLDATTALRFHFGEVALSAAGARRSDHGLRHPADFGGAVRDPGAGGDGVPSRQLADTAGDRAAAGARHHHAVAPLGASSPGAGGHRFDLRHDLQLLGPLVRHHHADRAPAADAARRRRPGGAADDRADRASDSQ